LIPSNPFRRFRAETGKEGRAPDLITDVELAAIHQTAAPHLRWAIEIMLETGVRPGTTELLALKMADVDFEAGGLWLARQKTNSPRSLLPLRQEFLVRLRAVALAEPGRSWLVEYKGRQVGSLKTAWLWALKRAGVTRRLRLYDLRHWYASRMLSGGADIKAVSELMGHASPVTTMTTYYHLLEGQKRQALDSLRVPNLSISGKPVDKPGVPKQAK
jgi:integrase